MSKYWKFTVKIVDAATDQEINSGADIHYGHSSSFSASSSNKLTLGSSQNVSTTDSNTSFYFRAVLNSGWVLQKWSLYCSKLTSSKRTQEFTNNPGGAWNLSSVASSSSGSRTEGIVTLYIYSETVNVSFNGNGGNAPSNTKTVTVGGYYDYLPTPTRSGYSFAGWYTAASGGTLVTADTTVTNLADHTLYAHWGSASSATISFNAHGGSGAPSSISFTTGSVVAIPDTKPTRSGYIFAGWAVDSNGYQVEYFPGKTYYPTASMTLYAAWRRALSVRSYSGSVVDQYRTLFSAQYASVSGLPSGVFLIPTLSPYIYAVSCCTTGAAPAYEDPDTWLYIALDTSGAYTFSSMSGTIGSASPSMRETARQLISSVVYSGGTAGPGYRKLTLGVDVDALDAAGYEFEGWFHTKAGGTSATGYYTGTDARLRYGDQLFTELETLMPPAGHHMVAPLVRKKRYVCAFDAQGGTVSPVFKYVTYNDAYGTLPTPTLSGYSFVGWFTAASGGTQVTASTVFTSKLDHVLYAHWSASGQTRTLYFDPAGGTCSMASKAVTVGSAFGTLPTPTRSGYSFVGWFRSTVGTDQVTSSTVAADENLTVYAHWSATSLTITFNANGGTVSEASRMIAYGWQYGQLPVPMRNGYNFEGWYTAQTGGTAVGASTVATASLTVWAHWSNGTAAWGYVKYKIKLITNGGTVASSYGELKYVAGYAKALPTVAEVTKAGATFGGWYETADFSGSAVTTIPASATGSRKYYARWM